MACRIEVMNSSRRRRPNLIAFTVGFASTGLLATIPLPNAKAAEWADLRVTFVYEASEAPNRKRIAPLADATCMPESMMPLSEEFIVDPITMGIQNVALYIDSKNSGLQKSDTHPALQSVPSEPASLEIRKCVFEPHIFISRVGQKLKLINSDEYGHNPNFIFFANDPESRMQPPGQSVEIELANSEKTPSPIRCNIHPWMQAYVLVFDHPYTGVSDQHGVVNIEKLPAGKAITFKIWHESMAKSIDEVSFNGMPTIWPKGNFQLTLAPGMNDLGAIKIKPDEFKD